MLELLSLSEAALLTGKSESLLKKQAQLGQLPGACKVKKKTREVWAIPASSIGSGLTYAALFSGWIEALRSGEAMKNRRPATKRTIEVYEWGINHLWKLAGVEASVQAFGPALLEKAFANVPFEDAREYDGYSFKDNLYKPFRNFLRYLIKQGVRSGSDWEAVNALKPTRTFKPKRKVVREGEFQALIEANDALASGRDSHGVERQATKAVLYLIGRGGLRREEVATLTLDDLDFNRLEISVLGKGRKRRRVPMTDDMVPALQAWVQRYRPETKHPQLIVSVKGEPLTPTAIYLKIKRLGNHARLNRNPHAFRRFFVTNALERNVSPVHVQLVAGHASLTTTLGYSMPEEAAALDAIREAYRQ